MIQRFATSVIYLTRSTFFILCIMVVILSRLAPSMTAYADGNTLYVMEDGEDDLSCGAELDPCATIGQAVANSTSGDIIIVGAGMFIPPASTPITIDKSLTIRGQGAANTMVYRMGTSRRVFDISGSSVVVTLEDLTVWNGAATGAAGGGVKVYSGASLVLDSVTLKDNRAANGAGVYLEGDGNLTVNNSTFTGNIATANGGAIYMTGAGILSITSSTFGGGSSTGNQAVNGAAIFQVDSVGFISGGTFSYNAASTSGGAVYLSGSDATLSISDGALFTSNTASSNGAAFYIADGALTTNGDVVISNNTATVNGGGISQAGGTVSLTDTTVSSNNAVLGAGIYQQAGTLSTSRMTINANTASTSGAGFYLASTSGANTLANTTISGNIANGTGTTDGGGAVYKSGSSTLSFDSVTVAFNTAARNANSGVRVVSGSGTVSALNTIFYKNGTGTTHANCSGTITDYESRNSNLDSGTTCGFSTERSSKDPQLVSLADNGGLTYTHAFPYLSGANPALDAGYTNLVEDQRGKIRPDGSNPDVGAFEFQRPAISLNTAGALSYTELDTATQIAPAATYSDDVTNFASGDVLTVTLSSAQAGDMLSIKTTSKIQVIESSGSFYVLYDGSANIASVSGAKYQATPDSSPLIISFTSNASRTAIEYLLRAISFENTEINPDTTTRSASFVIHHGDVDSAGVNRDISVSNPNLPPIASNVNININESETYTDTNFANSDHYNDPDGHPIYGIIVTQLPLHGSLTVDGANVILDETMPLGTGDVVYSPTPGYFGYDSFQWKAVDNGDEVTPGSNRKASTSSATYSITLIEVNDAPTTNSQTTKALASVNEDTPTPAGNTVTDLIESETTAYYDADSDPLAGVGIVANTATVSQGYWQFSTDSGGSWTNISSEIDADIDDTKALVLESAGMLRFLPAADWNGTPGYLTLRVWDGTTGQSSGSGGTLRDISSLIGGTGAYSSDTITLTTIITAVNDAPTAVNLSSTEVAENLPVGTLVATITTDDVDLITNPSTETITYTLGGDDAAKFTISGDELLTAEMFDFEVTSLYSITIEAEDSGSLTVVDPFTITVTDDVLSVSITNTTPGAGTANEKDIPENGEFTLSLEKSYPYTITVNFTTTTSTADEFDYSLLDGTTPLTGTITFPADTITKTVTVNVTNDDVVEGNETVVLSLLDTDNVDVTVAPSPDDSATVTITDDDTSAASITADIPTAVEGGTDGQFTVSLTKVSKSNTSVIYSISGTAINGTDYTSLGSGDPLTGTALIAANTLTTTIDVEALTDNLVEGTQTVILTLTSTDNPSISASGSDTVSVQDVDTGIISIDGTTNAREPSTNGLFTVSLSPLAEYDVSVALNSPASPTDYQALPTSATILAGHSSATIPVTVINDAYDEYDEPLTITLGTITGHGDSQFSLGTSSDSILIIDDDPLPKISINDVTVTAEGAAGTTTDAHFTISLDRGTEKLVRVNYSTSDDTANAGSDYDTLSGTHTFITTTHQTSFSFDVTVNGDDLVEGNETFDANLILVDSLNAVVNKGVGVATIVDDDTALASITASTATTNEGSGSPGVYTVSFTKAAQEDVAVSYSVSGSATSGTDYSALSGVVIITANSLTGTINLSSIADNLVEGNETVIVTLLSTDNERVTIDPDEGDKAATVTIVDDDLAVVSVSASTPTTTEGSGTPGVFTISLDKPTQSGVTVTYTITGSAASGIDYSALSDSAYIAPLSSTVSVNVLSIEDNVVEGDESVGLTISSTDHPRVSVATGEDKSATVTINDNDTAEISVTATQSAAAENEGGSPTDGEYLISMSNPARADVTVDVALSGTATDGIDFTSVALTATIPAGNTFITTTLAVIDDDLVEGDETVIITISNPQASGGLDSGRFSISPTSPTATVTIADDDTATLSIEATTTPAAEGGSNGEFTITATKASQADVLINYSISGTAENGTDYTDGTVPLSGTVTLPATQTSVTIPVAVEDDLLVEGDETVVLTLTAPVAGRVVIDSGSGSTATLTIQDNDQALISIEKLADTAENGVAQSFLISVTKASQADLPVSFSLSGTADSSGAYQDYNLSSGDGDLTGTVLTIPGGITSTHLTVTPVDDSYVEGTETLTVTLIAPTSGLAVIDDDNEIASMAIADDDTATLTIASSGSPSEDGATGTFTISASKISQAPVVVGYSISGTAANGTDYKSSGAALTGSVTIPAYTASVDIPITVVNDLIVETNESIILTLTSPDSGLVQIDTGSGKTANLTIIDNDTATISVAKVSNASEGGSAGSFRVSVTKASQDAVAVTFVLGGTATFTDDYSISSPDAQSLTSSVVTLAPGALSALIQINSVDDNLVEGTENLVMILTAPTSGKVTVGTPNTASLDLTDNDTATISIAQTADATEDGQDGSFTVTATKPSAIDVTLTFSVSGSADKDGIHQDFTLTSTNETLTSTTITLPAGEITTTIDVLAVDDVVVEPTENVTVTLTQSSSALAPVVSGAGSSASVAIEDNDTAIVSISSSVSSISEADASMQFTVTVTKASQQAVIMTYTPGGVAVNGVDYNQVTPLSGTVTIPAYGTQATIDLLPVQDNLVEGDESASITLTGTDFDKVSIASDGSQTSNITLVDDDSAQISVAATQSAAAENGVGTPTDGEYTISMTKPARADITVDITMTGTATNGTDYANIGATVTIPAGEITKTIKLDVTEDVIVEGDETAMMTISNPVASGGLDSGLFTIPITTSAATVTITDDDTALASIAKTNDGAEPDSDGQFTVSVDKVSQAAVTVTYEVDATSTATADSDYTALSGEVTILAGQGSANITVDVMNDTIAENAETVILNLIGTDSSRVTIHPIDNTASLSITSDDPDPVITTSPITVTEGTGGTTTAVFEVSMDRDSQKGVSVDYTTQDGTAVQPGDYTMITGTLTLGNGVISDTVEVTVEGDNLVEGDEAFNLVLSDAVNATLSNSESTLSVSGEIEDDDEASVSIAKTADGAEPGTNGQFTLTMTNPAQVNTTVSYTVSGTATAGSDYSTLSGTATIQAGQTSQTIAVTVINDNVAEFSETVVVTLTGASGLVTLDETPANLTATVNIADDETDPTISINDVSVTEGDSGTKEATFTVTLSRKSEKGVTVQYHTTNSTAISPDDYQSTSGTLSFGSNDLTKNITVNIVGDLVVEVDKTYNVVLQNPSYATINKGVGTGTIVDNDTAEVSVANSGNAAEEGLAAGEYTVSLTKLVESDVTVSYTVSGTATAGSDYTSLSGTVIVPANNLSTTIAVTPLQDELIEGVEYVTVTLVSTNNSRVSVDALPENKTATVSISDNDTATVSVDATVSSTEEGSLTAGQFTITTTKASQSPVIVYYSVTGSATADSDYTALSGSATIAAGTYATTVEVASIEDELVEGSEAVTITLTSTNNSSISVDPEPENATASVTITDNDTSEISIAATQSAAAENGSGTPTDGEYTVSMTKAARADVTVDVTMSGSATNGTDYANIDATVTIPAGEISKTISLEITEDVIVEGSETAILTISNPVASGGLSNGLFSISGIAYEATVIISDDDEASVSIEKTEDASEPDTNGLFTLTMTNPAKVDTTVTYTVTGTATPGLDYTPLSESVVIPAGEITNTITVEVKDDEIAENSETVQVTLTGASGLVTLDSTPANLTATVNITDDDPNPVITTSPITVTEGTGGTTTAVFEVSMDRDSQKGVSVDYTTQDGTAVQPGDYTMITGTLILGNGVISDTVEVTVQGDNLVEGNETFNLVLSDAVNATLSNSESTLSVSGEIEDDDEASVSIAKTADGAEPGTNGQFTLTMTNPAQVNTTVSYTVSGTATAGSDYSTLSGTATIQAGQTSQTIAVTVINDNIAEFSETVVVTLTGASGLVTLDETPANLTATVNIADDETDPTISINDVSVTEGDSGTKEATFTVTLSRKSEKGVTVQYRTTNGTAVSPDDYQSTSGTLSFGSNDLTKNITVNIVGDLVVEVDKTYNVVLENPSYATINKGVGTGTIVDNDTAEVSVANSGNAAEEGLAAGEYTVSLTKLVESDVTVSYTVSGTATAGSDYTSLSGTVIVPANNLSTTIAVTPLQDELIEGVEYVTVTLVSTNNSRVSVDALPENKTATVSISDNDTATVSVDATVSSTEEGSLTAGQFTITTTKASQSPVVVYYDLSGSAVSGSDYTSLIGSVTIPASSLSTIVEISPIDDNLVEGTEAVTITLTGTNNGSINVDPEPENATASVTITDNDTSEISIVATQSAAAENGVGIPTDGEYTVLMTKAARADVTVDVTMSGSATNGTDYANIGDTVTIPAGEISKTISLEITEDVIVEGSETAILTISNPVASGGLSNGLFSISGTAYEAMVTITDDDEASVSIEKTEDASEPDTNGLFTLTMTNPAKVDTTVTYTVTGTATPGLDYTPLSESVVIPAGEITNTITVEVKDDEIAENSETVQVTLTGASGLVTLDSTPANLTATVNITDDDPDPVITTSPITVTEGTGGTSLATFTVSMDRDSQKGVGVDYATQDGTAVQPGDYTMITGTLTLGNGVISDTVEVTVQGDNLVEGNETFNLVLSDAVNATLSNSESTLSVSGEIEDDDEASVSITKTADGAEPGTNGQFTLTMTNPAQVNATVTYTVAGTASAGSDYTTLSGSAIILAQSTSTTISVPVLDDTISENSETVIVTLSNVSGSKGNFAINESQKVATVNIADNEENAKISVQNVTKSENAGTFTFTVSLDRLSEKGVTVQYMSASNTATDYDDFTPVSGTLSFGSTQSSLPITVTVVNDSLIEGDETFTIVLYNPTNATITKGSAIGTIQDDDFAKISLEKTTDAEEDSTDGQFTVLIDNTINQDVQVSYTIEPTSTATSGTDYTALLGTVTIPANQSSAVITIDVISDALVEGDETIQLTLTGENSNLAVITDVPEDKTAEMTIIDNDTALISVSASTPIAGEPDTDGKFTISLNNPTQDAITVTYNVTGTATKDDDYTALTGSVIIPALSSTADVVVNVLDDSLPENAETVILTLTGPNNSLFSVDTSSGHDTATVTISDDELNPTISVDDEEITEGDTVTKTLTFEVKLSAISAKTGTVDYALEDVSATAGEDYGPISGTLTFVPGDTSELVNVSIIGDLLAEGDETFNLKLSNAVNLTIGDDTAVGTILDNENAKISIEKTTDAEEDSTDGQFTVSVDTLVAEDVDVTYIVEATSTAASGTDYTALSGTVTIPANSASAVIDVEVIGDTLVEGDETLQVTLTGDNSTLAAITDVPEDKTAQMTITDNDTGSISVSASTPNAAEPSSNGEFTISLDNPTQAALTVTYTVSGTATSGSDYTGLSGSAIIPAQGTYVTVTVSVQNDSLPEYAETVEMTLTGPNNSLFTVGTPDKATVTINDDDPDPTTSVNDPQVTEGDTLTSAMTFTITLSGVSAKTGTVDYELEGVSATAGVDFEVISGTLTFLPGDTSKTVDVSIIGDLLAEGDETFNLKLSNAVNITIDDDTGVGTIIDDEIAVITLAKTTDAEEDSTDGQFTVSVDTLVAEDVDVTYIVEATSTAASGTDYTALSGTVTIPANSASAVIDVEVIGDTLVEGDETLQVTLTGDNSTLAAITDVPEDKTAQMTITDNDTGSISVSASTPNAAEPSSNGEFTISLDNPTQAALTVTYTVSGTATSGSDYTGLSGSAIIPAQGTYVTVTVSVQNDSLPEYAETVEMTLTGPNNSLFTVGTPDKATVTINDDDPDPTTSVNDPQVTEGDTLTSAMTFTITLSGVSAKTGTVDYELEGVSATAGVDFEVISGTLTFLPGDTSKTVDVSIIGDLLAEGDETFNLKLSNAVNITIDDDTGVGTIIDDEIAVITLAKTTDAEEDSTDGQFTVSVDTLVAEDVDVTYIVEATSTAASGTDYTALSGTVTIPANSASAVIDVEVIGDTLVEGDETLQVTLTGDNSTLAAITDVPEDKTAQMTITDNDTGSISVSASTPNAAEPSSNGEFTISLDNPTQAALTVTYTVSGTATSGSDYTGLSGSAIIPAQGTYVTVTVSVQNDSLPEYAETVEMTLTGPNNSLFTVGTPDKATVTINDDDPDPTTSVNDPQVTEGDTLTSAMTFTITLSGVSAKTGTVDYELEGVSATAGVDFEVISGTLTFLPGDTSKTVDVSIIGDLLAEGDETFNLKLSNAVNITIDDDTGVGTILDNDIATVSVATTTNAKEDDTDGQFTLSVAPLAEEDIQISYTIEATSTATSGSDYTALSGTITIPSNQSTAVIDVEVISDTLVEGDETIQLTLTGVSDGLSKITDVPEDKTALMTITDNDTALISVTASTPNAAEPSTDGEFTISLDNPTQEALTVTYTVSGTATSGSDYTEMNGSAAIPASGSSTAVNVGVLDDLIPENAETVIVMLTGPNNALFSVDTSADEATVNISDNDPNPTVSVNDASVVEGDSGNVTLTFTVTLSSASAKTSTVDYSLLGLSATSGIDFEPKSGTLTFLPGDTVETVDVNIIGDLTAEGDETFNLKLSNPVNLTISDDTGVGTILDDDTSELSINNVSQLEGNYGTTAFVFTVSMDPASADTVTVDYDTENGTATAGSDYTAASGTLTFHPMDTTNSITVYVNGDTLYESDETFLVTLSNASGNAEISQTASQGTGTIQNDETQPILTIGAVTQNEGNSGTTTYNFPVTLNPASASVVTVAYATENGTATAGSDYTAKTGTLSFNQGETSKTVSVNAIGDRLVEPNETFLVRLSNPTNAGFTGGVTSVTATGTLTNDDHAPTLASSVNVEVNEDNTLSFTSATFTNAYNDADNDPLASITILSLPTHGNLKLSTTDIVINQVILVANLSSIRYTPQPDYFGSDTFNWTASDGVNLASSSSRVDITVNSVNDPPTLDNIANLEVILSTASQQIQLTGISGGVDGNIATLIVTAVSDNPGVIPDPQATYNTQNSTWSLSLEPTGAVGTANITVTVDDGGAENNIVTRNFSVSVKNPSIVISPTGSLITNEGGATAVFSVTLGVKPLGNVIITVSSSNTAEGTVSPSTLTFTPSNWDTPQQVMITGVDDALVDGDVAYLIILNPSSSVDNEYRTMGNVTVNVVNEDNEEIVTNWFAFLPVLIK